jgi:signal peptidase II
VVADQLAKQWIVANYTLNASQPILGDWLRINFIHNGGALFGVLQGTAPLFAVITIAVVGLIVAMELRWGWRSWAMTLALALLLGGAVGNLIDRVRLGYVVDFADIGIGTWRWYVFNVADMAVTCFFLLIVGIWLLAPRLLAGNEEAPSPGGEPHTRNEGPVAK